MTAIAITSAFVDPPAGAGIWSSELLATHLHDCLRARGRGFYLKLFGDALDDIMAPRFCTTVVFVTGALLLLSVFA